VSAGGIRPGAFYAWTKEFMEAGKERLTRDTVRDATRLEIERTNRENGELKQLVAELSLECTVSKKRLCRTGGRWRYQRVSHEERALLMAKVAGIPGPKRRALAQVGLPKSTYYRWRGRQVQRGTQQVGNGIEGLEPAHA